MYCKISLAKSFFYCLKKLNSGTQIWTVPLILHLIIDFYGIDHYIGFSRAGKIVPNSISKIKLPPKAISSKSVPVIEFKFYIVYWVSWEVKWGEGSVSLRKNTLHFIWWWLCKWLLFHLSLISGKLSVKFKHSSV